MNTLKLLIVDDEPGIRSGAKRVLQDFTVGYPFMDEDFSFDIVEAATGEKALEFIENDTIDIILLDNKLPGIEGIEVLEYIKKNNYDISVMMITSYASLELAIKATNNGAFNFVPKPFTPFQFLSVLSHELKSPINAIEGYLRMMQEKQIGDNVDDYKEMIDRSIERIKGMRSLILDLLDLTRMESGKKKRDLRKTDVAEIAKNVIDSIEPLAIQRNIKIHFETEENTYMNADKSELEIIINNLVSNAVKYNVESGKVFVKIFHSDNQLQIIVQDTGIGMSQEEMDLLFQDFVRIKNEKTKYVTGSGLGLSIAKKMTELYGGTIKVESEADKGSTFIVSIPVIKN
jgi:signal transduction histidine kinase